MTRLYNVIAIVECPGTVNHGSKFYLSDESKPMAHKEACTFMSKLTKYSWRRVLLEESV
jgi:hypothetical protein